MRLTSGAIHLGGIYLQLNKPAELKEYRAFSNGSEVGAGASGPGCEP